MDPAKVVDNILEYIISLNEGFDKYVFQRKIDELRYIVDTFGLNDIDFNALFKLWLSLNIPDSNWISLGTTLVPQEMATKVTVDYALTWILDNYYLDSKFFRIAFVLDWLTAAMDCDSVDMKALGVGYELFYSMLKYETLAEHATKLVYTLTKQSDVTIKRVQDLMIYAEKIRGKKVLYQQIRLILAVFKYYKPEYVPEDAVPLISIHTGFKKINVTLLTRFKNLQNRRNSISTEKQRLWINPLNYVLKRNKKTPPLIPNMSFANIGATQNGNKAQKNYLDFSDPVSLLEYSSTHDMPRPMRLRSLLMNETGMILLATAPQSQQAFLSEELRHLLANCFLETSPHSYYEKRDLLKKLAIFQSLLMQGIPAVTHFLAQFLPFWNEKDFRAEILQLVEWVNVEGTGHINVILDVLTKVYFRAQPLEQCSIMRSITSMYNNLVYSSTRPRHFFLSVQPTKPMYSELLSLVSLRISDLGNKGLQESPEDVRTLWSVTQAGVRSARAGVRGQTRAVPPGLLSLALPLLSPSAALLDSLAELTLLHKKIYSIMKAKNGHKDQAYMKQIQLMKAFTYDFVSCFCEIIFRERGNGIIFSRLSPQLVSDLYDLIPDVDTKLSIRNHLAFAPYTYVPLALQGLQATEHKDADNKLWFDTVISQEFHYFSLLVKRLMPELL